jgi:hypothetical protein
MAQHWFIKKIKIVGNEGKKRRKKSWNLKQPFNPSFQVHMEEMETEY